MLTWEASDSCIITWSLTSYTTLRRFDKNMSNLNPAKARRTRKFGILIPFGDLKIFEKGQCGEPLADAKEQPLELFILYANGHLAI